MSNKIITFQECWNILTEEEIGQNPTRELLDWLLKLTENKIKYEVVEGCQVIDNHHLKVTGKYQILKKLYMEKYSYTEKEFVEQFLS